MVWPEDVPPEVVAQQRSAAKKEPAPRKPALRAIDGNASADSADRQGESEEASPNAQRSVAPTSKSGKQAGLRRVSAVPPRAAAQPGTDAELEAEVNGPAEPATPDLATPELATRQRSESAAPSKRQRPPYLRLVR